MLSATEDIFKTSWLLRLVSLPDTNFTKQGTLAGEIYSTICVWAGDHFGLGLKEIDPLLTKV